MASIAAPEILHHPAAQAGPRADRLPALDGLRGIAAVTVLVFHALSIFNYGPALSGKGYLAVDFFFMLSGYVMARTYEHRMAQGLGTGVFLWMRYRRLWPVMTIGALVGAPLLFLKSADAGAFAALLLPNLVLLPVFTGSLLFPVNGSAWSILFELAANALHAAVLWRLRIPTLAAIVVAMAAAMVWATAEYGSFDVGARPRNAQGGLPRALLSYVAGVVLWRWWGESPTPKVPPALAFLAMPVFAAAVSLLGARSEVLDFAFVLALCPLIIAGGLRADIGQPALRAAVHWGGALSFPLYAVHMPILNAAHMLGLGAPAGVALSLLAGVAVALGLGLFGSWRKARLAA